MFMLPLRYNIQVATAVTGQEFYFVKQKQEVVQMIAKFTLMALLFFTEDETCLKWNINRSESRPACSTDMSCCMNGSRLSASSIKLHLKRCLAPRTTFSFGASEFL